MKDHTLNILNVLKRPVVTEKSERLSVNGCYVFRVLKAANKHSIKRAVETAFGVTVQAVRIVNVKSKKRRFRMVQGVVPGWKKAYVTVEKGQQIEMEQE